MKNYVEKGTRIMFSAGKEDYIDFERLRKDLIDEFGAQMVTITGAMGYSDMCDTQNATENQLLEIAKREGINIGKYRK